MRFIDADAITRSTELTKKIVVHDLTPYIKVDDLLEFIDKLPTAYDIEKVVAELETELRVTRNVQSIECIKNDGYGTSRQAKNSGKIEMLLKAIGIVKAGGVECENLINRRNQILSANIVKHSTMTKNVVVGVRFIQNQRIIGTDASSLFGIINTIRK